MARKRLIAPEFFTHGDLYDAESQTDLPLRLAFAGLWTQCDRRGLFRWRPRELKLAILPYDNVDFGAVLDALVAFGFVERYEVDGKEYGRVPSLGAWQTFNIHEKAAPDIPAPSQDGASTTAAPSQDGASTPGTGTGTGTGTDISTGTGSVRRKRGERASTTTADAVPALEEPWIAAGASWWRANAGRVTDSTFRKAIAPSVETHGWEAVHRGLEYFVTRQRSLNRGLRLEWFVSEDARWIGDSAPQIIGADGNEAEIMAYVTSPEYLRGAKR